MRRSDTFDWDDFVRQMSDDELADELETLDDMEDTCCHRAGGRRKEVDDDEV